MRSALTIPHLILSRPSRCAAGALALLLAVGLLAAPCGWAQAADAKDEPLLGQLLPEDESEDGEASTPNAGRKARSLASILQSQGALASELAELQARLETEAARGREAVIREEIGEISAKIEALDYSFSELAAEIDPNDFTDDEEQARLDLGGEIRELLGPLIGELKRATSRPREIDRLRTEIDRTEEQLELIATGLGNLAVLTAGVQDPSLRAALEQERTDWVALNLELATRYEIDRQRLDQMLSEQTSFGEALESVFQLFFKSRGRNLILALGATILFMLLLRRLQAQALQTSAMQRRGDSLLPRILNLLFVVFMGIGGVLVFLLVLYFFGDWVLLVLVLLVVFGALWASKQAIPRFWTQATLLLNLGPVREGERIQIDGLPWRIEQLNFYTDLVNDRLTGGKLRLPIGDLTDARSREWDEAEPWFPCEEGDWVVLSDDTFGQIDVQTPEQVVLRLMGGAVRTLPTATFLEARPTNLSQGFTAKKVFGLDYAHIGIVTEEIPRLLQTFVRDGLQQTPVAEWVEDVEVFFDDAAASSVNVRVIATIAGGGASFYKIVPRMIAKLCVDACNAYGWQIPFAQLTVHRADLPTDGGDA